MTNQFDHDAPENFDGALQERYRRLSLLTLDLAEEAGEAALCAKAHKNENFNFSLVGKSDKPGRFERRIAAMTRAIWAHQIVERLRRGGAIEQMRARQAPSADVLNAAERLQRPDHFSLTSGGRTQITKAPVAISDTLAGACGVDDPLQDGFLSGDPEHSAAPDIGRDRDPSLTDEASFATILRDPDASIQAFIEALAADDLEKQERPCPANGAAHSQTPPQSAALFAPP